MLKTASITAMLHLSKEETEMSDIGEKTETTETTIEIEEETEIEKGIETETEMTTEIENIADILNRALPVVLIENTVETTTDAGREKEIDTHLRREAIPLVADIDRHNLTHIMPPVNLVLLNSPLAFPVFLNLS